MLTQTFQSLGGDNILTNQLDRPDEPSMRKPASRVVDSFNDCFVSETDWNSFPAYKAPDIWDRVRSGMTLDLSDNPRVAKERKRYLRSPKGLANIIARAEPYLFHIVGELEKRDMPLEIALLPAVESGFDPFAYSHGRASGIWQFIPGTGKMLGLEQNWWYDGRRDIVKSTSAALTYLERHHKRFEGDWLLATASYNSGAGNVAKAVRKNRAKNKPIDFWNLKLPKETLAYVPRLIAISQIVAEPEKYGIELAPVKNVPYFAEVDIGSQIDLSQVAEMATISMDELYQLNPAFNQWATNPSGPHTMLVPVEKLASFELQLAAIPKEDRISWRRYTIRSGDSLSTIAARYGIDTASLRKVNNLRGDKIRAGKKLIVPVPAQGASFYSLSSKERLEKKQARLAKRHAGSRVDYKVVKGDSFWSISRRYGTSHAKIARWNGLAPGDPIKPGQKLVIWTKQPQHAAVQNSNAVIRKVAYRVRSGDSLARIADKFRLNVTDILSWNSINPAKYLQPGDSLTLFVDVTRVN